MAVVRERRAPAKRRLIEILLALLAVEATLQLAALADPRIRLLLSPGIPLELPDETLGRRPNPALPDHDARGYRNPAALAQADLVVMGDSQTYGSEVSRSNAWPARLGAAIGVPTYSLAFGSWGPAQYFLVADQAFALSPKLLVVAIYAGNDLAEAFVVTTRHDISALREGSPHDLAFYRAIDAKEGPLGEAWLATRAARRGSFSTWARPHAELLARHFKTYGLIRGLSRIGPAEEAQTRRDKVRSDFDRYAAEISGLSPELFFPFRTGRVGTVLTPASRREVTDLRDPRVEEGLRITLRVLRLLNERCGDSCRLVVVSIPTKELAFSEAVERSGVEAPRAYRELVVAEEDLWRRLHAGLEAEGIASIDVRVPLARAIRAGRNPYLADWDGHPNVVGNEVIAGHVAAQPSLRLLVDRSGSPPQGPGE